MTQRLKDIVDEVFVKEGKVAAMARFSLATGKSQRMLERYLHGSSHPSRETAFKLALACGLSEEEALQIAKECSSEGARETA